MQTIFIFKDEVTIKDLALIGRWDNDIAPAKKNDKSPFS